MSEWLEFCKTAHPSYKETAVLGLKFTVGDISVDETSPLVSIEYYADNPCQQVGGLTTNCMENMWWVKIIAKDVGTGLNSFTSSDLSADCEDKAKLDYDINSANHIGQIHNSNVTMDDNNGNK